ncbi:M16 family metallopeptidase [Thiosulfativibrio zosterae]|uniref:Peptidase M16 n=1 Tax=Thiosulfativibrio zosterae TaxID=2675053 RepID=A0A6F8PK86_9GAMM|nr:pitrilysin family protein [Thiosulfativibrio zosterae]BBP42512.1 peptidase M16 [Thiosulfativibrio zosterae]
MNSFKILFSAIVKQSVLGVGLMALSVSVWADVNIQSWQTSNGAKVMFVASPELPMLDIQVSFDAGSARDGAQFGLANMTMGLLGTATTKHTEDEISAAFNDLGAQIGGSANRDMAQLSLKTLTRPSIMQPALAMFQEVLHQPVFSEEILTREKSRLTQALKQKTTKPQTIASEAMMENLYGNHPYAHPTEGTLETIAPITTQDLQAFYQRYFVAKNTVIAMVGNVTPQQAKDIAESLSKGLKAGEKPAPLPKPSSFKAMDINIKFDSSQTYYSLSHLGVERGNPDYYALFLGNHLLGGSGFGSLLMENVREKRGLVYSVYSYLAPMKVAGPFLIGLSTKNASAYEADAVVKETLKGFLKDFDESHLQAIKDNLIGGFPLRVDSNGKLIGYLSMIGFYNLPLDYLEDFPKQMAALTKAQVLTAWQKLLEDQQMLRVMVGNPTPK